MPGDWLNHLAAGAPIKFSTRRENLITETVRSFQRNRKPVKSDPLSDGSPEGLILVRNDADDDCEEYDVLGIDDIATATPHDNLNQFKWGAPVLSGVTPTTSGYAGKFVITAEPIKKGEIGRAWIAGWCKAYIDVVDESATFADVTDGDTDHLTSSASGAAQILWKESGTGLKWGIVRLALGGGLPPGGVERQVLQRIDSIGTPGWYWTLIHD